MRSSSQATTSRTGGRRTLQAPPRANRSPRIGTSRDIDKNANPWLARLQSKGRAGIQILADFLAYSDMSKTGVIHGPVTHAPRLWAPAHCRSSDRQSIRRRDRLSAAREACSFFRRAVGLRGRGERYRVGRMARTASAYPSGVVSYVHQRTPFHHARIRSVLNRLGSPPTFLCFIGCGAWPPAEPEREEGDACTGIR